MKKIPWWEPKVGAKELEIVTKVLKSNFLNEGDYTTRFEEEVVRLLGCKYALAVTSGTIGMFLSLKALGIGYGDEVIVSDMTFIATANAVSMCGATPILVDVDQDTLNMDPRSFEKAITKKTKAVIPTHVSGRGAEMEGVLTVARKNNIYVIEDAAEAFMSKYNGKFLGTFGITGCFSFSPPKIITTGQGGTIVTNDKKIYWILRELKDQGRPNRGTGGADVHHSVGFNFKFTNLQAAVGLGQLTQLKKRMKRMKKINEIYRDYLHGATGITVFDADTKNGELPLWTDVLVEKRDQLEIFLRSRGIYCRKFWFPIHTQQPYLLSNRNFPVSIKLSPQALWLPSAFTMSDADVKYVARAIKKFLHG